LLTMRSMKVEYRESMTQKCTMSRFMASEDNA
jgi:hypothetical protein